MKRIHKLLILILLAAGLLAFGLPARAQQPPAKQKVPAQAIQPEQEPEYTEEEYDAWEKATQEQDLDKRATMLLAFLEKYPKSKLRPHIITAYQTLMYEHKQNQRWAKLLSTAEQWLKYYPEELQLYAYIAESAHRLGQNPKYLEYALKIYAAKPDCTLAASILQSYENEKNKEKSLEWTEKLLSCPEFAGNSDIRMVFVSKYWEEKKIDKAVEFARLALKSIEIAKKPDSVSDADWRKKLSEQRYSCHYIIGISQYDKERYPDAIKSFESALRQKRSGAPYYYIGLSLWKLDQVEEAIAAFAKCAVLGGEDQEKAKAHLEKLYKALHNNTTIGIDKVYSRAEKELAGKPQE